MYFFANENFPRTGIQQLRDAGHDVLAIAEYRPGSEDEDVLARAAREKRMILTFDRDYGELIYRQKLPVPAGVVYFRLGPIKSWEPAERVLQLLRIPDFTLEGKFTVVERGHVRQRPLP